MLATERASVYSQMQVLPRSLWNIHPRKGRLALQRPLQNLVFHEKTTNCRQKKMEMTFSEALTRVRSIAPAVSVWSRAAALGSLWAAFEIVVGSFLHNLRVPFAGTIMATASVLLLAAAAQVWEVKGLLWRAGLVCALMKSVSPSAVLLGPMIGIFAEGVILQIALSLLGRGWLGCMVGGAFAVSYTLLHKIVALTFTYGIDLVRVFTGIVRFASKVTGWQGLQPANVLFTLVMVQSAMGVAAGLAGWYVGQRVREQHTEEQGKFVARERGNSVAPFHRAEENNRSLVLLFTWLLLLPMGLQLIGTASLPLSVGMTAMAAGGAILRYRRVAKRFVNVRLWLEMVLVLLLSALALGAASGQIAEGLEAGARMALRAVLVVALFGAIGIEITHPRILRGLSKGRLAVVHAAVLWGFRALPAFLASIPDIKEVFRRPTSVFSYLFEEVDSWHKRFSERRLVLLAGERGEGKTTLCLALAERARRAGWTVGGIASPGWWVEGGRGGYRVRDLLTGEERLLAVRDGKATGISTGAFCFDKEGIEFGRRAIEAAVAQGVQLLVVDEVGPLELRGEGWAPVLHQALTGGTRAVVCVVRSKLVDEVQKTYPLLSSAAVIRAAETNADILLPLLDTLAGDSIAQAAPVISTSVVGRQ